jgi:predicted dithiol-disulfide oxidoreductase (DUF899 family)
MPAHRTATRDQWSTELGELLIREKEHTRVGDELARRRRELPWVRLEKQYTLQSEAGTRTLLELFAGRSQLTIYHFMFGPDWEAGCPTCSSTADSFDGVLPHLEACDVTLICVSRAPLEKLLAYRNRMGWSFEWASSYESDFNLDYGTSASGRAAASPTDGPGIVSSEVGLLRVLDEQPEIRLQMPLIAHRNATASGVDLDGYFSEGHGISTFARDGDEVYHCYSSYARGTEFLMSYYAILDRTPNGRAEEEQPMHWLRRRDEYGKH